MNDILTLIVVIILPFVVRIISSSLDENKESYAEEILREFGIDNNKNKGKTNKNKYKESLNFISNILSKTFVLILTLCVLFSFAFCGHLIHIGNIEFGLFYLFVGILGIVEIVVLIEDY